MRAQEFIAENTIKLSPQQRAYDWIQKVYAQYPQTWQNNHVMPMGGSGEDQQFAMFELTPSNSRRDAVEVKWFQAYPLRAGVGTRAMKELQRLAQADDIALTLYPWDKGQVSQAKLMKFYRGQGFRPINQGGKNMTWDPVAETFNNPYKTKSEKSEYGDIDMLAKLPDGTNLSIMFNNQGNDEWQVEFYRNNSQEVTGEGDAQRVFATVLTSMQKFIKKYKPWRLIFSANKDVQPGQNSESRAKLYNRLVQRYAAAWGYEEYSEDHGDQITYELTQLKPGVAENFADGRVKGKSRPGRVKRAGASCDGSVTDLRARAKRASGEKARMYHWCANMKSGKKK